MRLQVSLGEYNTKQYCNNIALSDLTPAQSSGNCHQFSIPISNFDCGFSQSSITQIGFQNVEGHSASICLDEIQIVGGASTSPDISSGGR